MAISDIERQYSKTYVNTVFELKCFRLLDFMGASSKPDSVHFREVLQQSLL